MDLQEGNAQIGTGIDNPHNPRIRIAAPIRLTRPSRSIRDVELLREAQIRTIGTRLIPALNGGRDRAQDDGEVQHLRLAPLVQDLVAQRLAVGLVQLGDRLDGVGALGDEGALAQEGEFAGEAVLGRERLDVGHQLVVREVGEGVLDPMGGGGLVSWMVFGWGWMDKWVDKWMDGWMDGWNGWMGALGGSRLTLPSCSAASS